MRVFIGYDAAEHLAYEAAVNSLKSRSPVEAEPLSEDRLRATGLYARNVDKRDGQYYDLPSNAPCSTEFATSRFLVPIICQSGWALFTDSDMIFLDDVRNILKYADPEKAVIVVKHQHEAKERRKMMGLIQTRYSRKNWSSVMLFNCDHPANARLSIRDVNERPGRDLHQFYWLNDSEIGEMPYEWNWLVGLQDKPQSPRIAHFTLGGPWLDNWIPKEFDEIWINEGRRDQRRA